MYLSRYTYLYTPFFLKTYKSLYKIVNTVNSKALSAGLSAFEPLTMVFSVC